MFTIFRPSRDLALWSLPPGPIPLFMFNSIYFLFLSSKYGHQRWRSREKLIWTLWLVCLMSENFFRQKRHWELWWYIIKQRDLVTTKPQYMKSVRPSKNSRYWIYRIIYRETVVWSHNTLIYIHVVWDRCTEYSTKKNNKRKIWE